MVTHGRYPGLEEGLEDRPQLARRHDLAGVLAVAEQLRLTRRKRFSRCGSRRACDHIPRRAAIPQNRQRANGTTPRATSPTPCVHHRCGDACATDAPVVAPARGGGGRVAASRANHQRDPGVTKYPRAGGSQKISRGTVVSTRTNGGPLEAASTAPDTPPGRRRPLAGRSRSSAACQQRGGSRSHEGHTHRDGTLWDIRPRGRNTRRLRDEGLGRKHRDHDCGHDDGQCERQGRPGGEAPHALSCTTGGSAPERSGPVALDAPGRGESTRGNGWSRTIKVRPSSRNRQWDKFGSGPGRQAILISRLEAESIGREVVVHVAAAHIRRVVVAGVPTRGRVEHGRGSEERRSVHRSDCAGE
jgi:hypothetical protein